MKVLTIKEPYASAIRAGLKHIETRSWKTNYRGEVIIHASKTSLPNERAEYILSKHYVPTRCGVFHCKARLVDCVYIDKAFLKKILNPENCLEYNLGFYEEGRYAWILEDIEPFDINAQEVIKGHLGIWNYFVDLSDITVEKGDVYVKYSVYDRITENKK